MKLPNARIEQATRKKDKVRPQLNNMRLDVEQHTLAATDGFILALVPVEVDDGDTSGYITPEAIALARKTRADSITADSALKLPDGTQLPRPKDADMPQWPNVAVVIPPKPDHEPDLIIDTALLLRLAEALNDQSQKKTATALKLWFSGRESPIYAEGNTVGAVGVIMPMVWD